MIYIDNAYKLDCENKIPYDNMTAVKASNLGYYLGPSNAVGSVFANTDQTIIIVKIKDDAARNYFYIKNNLSSVEIAHNIFKVIIEKK